MNEVACRSVLLHALVHANLPDKNLGQIKSREIQTKRVTNVGTNY